MLTAEGLAFEHPPEQRMTPYADSARPTRSLTTPIRSSRLALALTAATSQTTLVRGTAPYRPAELSWWRPRRPRA